MDYLVIIIINVVFHLLVLLLAVGFHIPAYHWHPSHCSLFIVRTTLKVSRNDDDNNNNNSNNNNNYYYYYLIYITPFAIRWTLWRLV